MKESMCTIRPGQRNPQVGETTSEEKAGAGEAREQDAEGAVSECGQSRAAGLGECRGEAKR